MDAEKITMYRPLEDKSGAVKQFPTTVSSQVFDEETGKTVVQQFDNVAQQLAQNLKDREDRGANIAAYGAQSDIDSTQYIAQALLNSNKIVVPDGRFSAIVDAIGKKVEGKTYGETFLVQTNNGDYTLSIGRLSDINNLTINNVNRYPNKTGITTKGVTSGSFSVNNVWVQNYNVGIDLSGAQYSYLENLFVHNNTTAIVIGADGRAWNGVVTVKKVNITGSQYGIKQLTSLTNTLFIENACLEGVNRAITNRGELNISKTYIGDTQRQEYLANGLGDCVIDAQSGSITKVSDSVVGMSVKDRSDNLVRGLIELNGTDDSPSEVIIDNSSISLVSQNVAGATNRHGYVYTSNSPNNRIVLNNVDFAPQGGSSAHNMVPFYLYDGFTCLHSYNPVKNYAINGCLTNDKATNLMLEQKTNLSIVPNLTNAFGGKVLKFTRFAYNVNYKVPPHLVGKKMALDLYISDWVTDKTQSLRLNYDNSDCVETGYVNFERALVRVGLRNPRLNRFTFTPNKEIGVIQIYCTKTSTAVEGEEGVYVAGVILKEIQYKNKLSQVIDADNVIYGIAPPTSGAWNVGDRITNSSPTTGGYVGWICTLSGTPGTWKGFGLIDS